MRSDPRVRRALSLPLLLGLAACGGGGSAPSPPPAAPAFTLQVSPAALQIPAGGSGFVTVTVSRLNGFRGDVDLEGAGFPVGVSASGRVVEGATSVQLPVLVAPAVAPAAFPALQIQGRSGSLSQMAAFSLTVQVPLPPGQGSVDAVQAAGASQAGGAYENRALALETLPAHTATGPGGAVQVRHGFLPAGSPAKP